MYMYVCMWCMSSCMIMLSILVCVGGDAYGHPSESHFEEILLI